MRLQAEKLQADMEGTEKFVFEAWEALRAAQEQRHSETPHRHEEEAASAVLKSQNDSDTYTSAMEPIESLSVNHQDDGEESSEGRSSVTAARSTLEGRPETVCVAVQTQKADALLSLRVANAEARISALEQKVSERESTRAAAEAGEEEVNVPTRTPTVPPFRRSRRQKRP